MKLATTALERLAIGVVSLALSVGLIALLSGFFASRDQAGVGAAGAVTGIQFPDLGHAHLRPGELRPLYNSQPPTSGAHIPQPVLHDHGTLSDDQLLSALEVGDVVFAYGEPAPPAKLVAVAKQVSGSFTPQLASAGEAAILMRRPGTRGVLGLAWRRIIRFPSAANPGLRVFAEQWLGRGAPGH